MDELMISRWNETVGADDTVYHLGDLGFHSDPEFLLPVLNRLNGRIHMVLGNHDFNPDLQPYAQERISTFQEYLKITVEGQPIVMCHYPLSEWDGSFRGTWHLYGHAHNQLPTSPWKTQDIGVDGHDFRPWSMDELRAIMSTRKNMDKSVYN